MASDDIVQTIKFEVEDPGGEFDKVLTASQKLVSDLQSKFDQSLSVKVDFQPVIDSAKQAEDAVKKIFDAGNAKMSGFDDAKKTIDGVTSSLDKANDAAKELNKTIAATTAPSTTTPPLPPHFANYPPPPAPPPAQTQAQIDEASRQRAAASLTSAGRSSTSPETFLERNKAFTGGDTFDTFGNLIKKFLGGGGGGGGGDGGGEPPAPGGGGGHGEAASAAEAIHTLREALHALHPALSEAGISMGELNAVMVAARGGAVALAASIGGLLVVAFEKAGDAANDAASRLGSFSGGGSQGVEAFEGLKKLAVQLDSTGAALAKPFEQLSRINTQQGLGISQENLQGILSTLVKGTQADRVPEADALKGLTEILSNIQKTGILSDSDIKALENLSPQLSQALLQAIEKVAPGKIAAGTVTGADVTTAAQTPDFKAQIDANNKAAKQFGDSISTAFDNVKSASERLAESLSGGQAIAETLNALAHFLQGLADQIDKLSPSGKTGVLGGAAAGGLGGAIVGGIIGQAVIPIPFVGAAAGAIVGSGAGALGGGAIGGAVGQGVNALQQNAPVSDQDRLNDAFKQVGETSKETTGSAHGLSDALKRLSDTSGDTQKQIAAQSAIANKAQAALDLQFLPAEQASTIAKDKLAIERADIAVKQAEINLQEAQKQKDLAALAPAQAQLGLAQAQNQLDTIHSTNALRRLQASGEDQGPGTSDQGDLERQRLAQSQREAADLQEKQAEMAVARAKIEVKYADLEGPKAELAAQQAKTAIKSAQIEQDDASLKLAKDSQGQPIARDLAALRYAQASLDEQQKLTQLGGEQLKTLQAILEKIGGGGSGDGSGSGTGNGTGSGGAQRISANDNKEPLGPGDYIQNGVVVRAQRINTVPTPTDTGGLNSGGFHQIFPVDNQFPPPPGLGKRSEIDFDQINQSVTQLASAFDTLKSATESNTQATDASAQKLQDTGTQPIEEATNAFASVETPVSEVGTSASETASALDGLTSKLEQAGSASQGGGSATTAAASGGLIRGPGSATSDSIHALLSDGEFVHSARATAFWGVDFMRAVNNLQIPRFNAGGLVGLFSPAMPRFADGGVVSGGGGMPHLGTVDLRTDHGSVTMMASPSAVNQLSKLAVTKRMTSTGRKPGFIG